MSSRPRVLVVEDDADIAELIQLHLEREDFRVFRSGDGAFGLQQAVALVPDLIVLDVMLPSLDGLAVCRRLQANERTRHVPIVFLSAKDEESDIVLGLESGAVDYLSKPFSPRELLARIRAILRRHSPATGTALASPNDGTHIVLGPLTIALDRHEALLNGRAVPLTLAEFRLLAALAARPGRVLTRDLLLEAIARGPSEVIDRNVDVHVRSIRKKLGPEGEGLISTIRGVGYSCRMPLDEKQKKRIHAAFTQT